MNNKDLLRIGLIVLSGIVLVYLISSYAKKHTAAEESVNEIEQFESNDSKSTQDTVSPGESMGKNEVYAPSNAEQGSGEFALDGNQYPKDCYPKDQLTPAELLPGDANSKWAQVNPAGQGELGDQNFLDAGYHVGVNTVGQTLRNANLQLRSEPPNPQVQVSPWMNTSMEPDTNRRAMEIGGCE